MYTRLRNQKYGSSDTTSEARRAAPVMKLKTHRNGQPAAAYMRLELLDNHMKSNRPGSKNHKYLLLEKMGQHEAILSDGVINIVPLLSLKAVL